MGALKRLHALCVVVVRAFRPADGRRFSKFGFHLAVKQRDESHKTHSRRRRGAEAPYYLADTATPEQRQWLTNAIPDEGAGTDGTPTASASTFASSNFTLDVSWP